MTPEDPRHGSYAGYIAHHKSGTPMCDPCAYAGYIARKRLHIAGPQLVPLGEQAWRKLANSPKTALGRATGLTPQMLSHVQAKGPEGRVHRRTKAKILRASVVTPIGITRRLRALAVVGWSVAEVARRAGLSRWNVEAARRDEGTRKYVRAEFAEALVKTYDELAYTRPPETRATLRQERLAQSKGWLPPMAWDVIDDPDEQPKGVLRGHEHVAKTAVDEHLVERVLAGEALPCTKAEKEEVTRRWVACGRSLHSLEQLTGWRSGRYGKASELLEEAS